MATSNQLLEAGALLAVKTKVKDASGVDEVSARTYEHAALQTPVVRLSADNLAAGDDLTMEFLGFETPEVNSGIAKRRRQALGFPEWALINDPKHARYALDLVRDFRREARRAGSKPGHAYEAFEKTCRKLGKSVAHFLPSYWEQAGREFIAVGNSTYASRAFGKAREAEKVHGLKVNEEVRKDAFLEFALAGCVSNKALMEYGRDLMSAHKPQEAWEFFRELCVRRTLGGMPPWTSMVKDLTALVKATKLDPDAELKAMFVEFIDSPALSRAPMGFWKGASALMGELANEDDHVAGVLLNLIPKTSSWRSEDLWPWLKYLEEWGILDNLWKAKVPNEAQARGGAAAWFRRAMESVHSFHQPLFDVLEKLAPRLKKEKQPLQLCKEERWGNDLEADADLVDFALSLKIKVADPQPGKKVEINLRDWADPDDDDEYSGAGDRPRDLALLAADRRFQPALREAVNYVAGEEQFEAAATGKAGLIETRRAWLMSLVAELTPGGLPAAEAALDQLQRCTSSATYREFPEAYRALGKVNLIPVVTRTLQAGIIDEYGWPVLEEVAGNYTSTDAKGRVSRPKIFGNFPYLILSDGLNATVIRGDEIVFEAELKLPKGHKLERLMYLDGDLTIWAEKRYDTKAWWHSAPKKKEDGWCYGGMGLGGLTYERPDGGTFIGKTVHSGQKGVMNLKVEHEILHDGEHFWRSTWGPGYERKVFKEIDPSSGKDGRVSMPTFMEEYITGKWELHTDTCSLAYYGDLVQKSPLGSSDGLIGLRARKKGKSFEYQGVDGRGLKTENEDLECFGLIAQPGTKKFLPMDNSPGLWDPTGTWRSAAVSSGIGGYNRGQVLELPLVYYHLMSMRDEAASRVLRRITQKQVKVLLAAEQKDFDTWSGKGSPKEDSGYSNLDKAIGKLLPATAPERFRTGLRGVLVKAGQKTRQLQKLIRNCDPRKKGATAAGAAADALAQPAMQHLSTWYRAEQGVSLFGTFSEAAAYFAGEDDEPEIPTSSFDALRAMFGDLPRRLWRGIVRAENDRSWLAFFEAWCELPIMDMEGSFRCYVLEIKKNNPLAELDPDDEDDDYDEDDEDAPQLVQTFEQKGNRYLVHRTWGRNFKVLEYAPNGRFQAIRNTTIDSSDEDESSSTESVWSADEFRQFLAAARENGISIPDRTLMLQLADETGLELAEIVYIWFGFPGESMYDSNLIPKEIREAYKLKVKEVKAAKTNIEMLPEHVQTALVHAPLAAGPLDLWENHEAVAQSIRDTWASEKPVRVELPDDVNRDVIDILGWSVEQADFLDALVDPAAHDFYRTKTKWSMKLDEDGDMILSSNSDGNVFNADILNVTVSIAALMAYRLPVGDPALANAAALIEAAAKALANPALLLEIASIYHDKEEFVSKTLTAAIGKPKPWGRSRHNIQQIADDGVTIGSQEGSYIRLAFRPTRVKTEKQLQKLKSQVAAFFTSEDVAEGAGESVNSATILKSKDFQAIAKRCTKSPLPENAWEANPQNSAGALVKKVAKSRKLSEDAATYYLQILALPDPTDRNVRTWNDWTPARIKKAGKELLDAGLVMQARRARAGRSFFLQGGWEALKTPHLPLETWKLPMFQMYRDAYDRATPLLKRIVPLDPVHQLFARAWKRVEAGDEPQYEEVG